MSDSRPPKDPKEVVEMREAMVAFRRAARGVKKSQPGFPRISTQLTKAPEPEEAKHDDDTTKKVLVPA